MPSVKMWLSMYLFTYLFGNVIFLFALGILDDLGQNQVVVEQQSMCVDPSHTLGPHSLQFALDNELSPQVIQVQD